MPCLTYVDYTPDILSVLCLFINITINWISLFVLDMLLLARKRLSLNVALLIHDTGHSLTNVSLGHGYNGKAEPANFISTFDILVLLACSVFGSIGIFIAFYIG